MTPEDKKWLKSVKEDLKELCSCCDNGDFAKSSLPRAIEIIDALEKENAELRDRIAPIDKKAAKKRIRETIHNFRV